MVEASLRLGERTVNCLLSMNLVFDPHKKLRWVIMTLRPEKEMRQLVRDQTGAIAYSTLDEIAGESAQIHRVRRQALTAAPARACVLIRGERGIGKNTLASAIHNQSPRRDGPFLMFSCASLPRPLAVSELLGYDAGMVPGRTGGRPSKFELAHTGTLILTSIDALPLDAQAALLNVLELGFVRRLGSDRPIPVDVRLIATTSANLEELIEQGSFRQDLFFRLSTFSIYVPPLRERPGDIPFLVARILARLSQPDGHPLHLSPDGLGVLRKHPWPGNQRELEAALEQAAQHASSGTIEVEDLPESVQRSVKIALKGKEPARYHSLAELERAAILQAAEVCRANRTEMARLLGVSRTTLWRTLRSMNISIDEDLNSKKR
jgi:transcriptional activator for dhaKLM operon